MTINSKRGPKRVYSAPRLVAYGDMAKLTRGGFGSVLEVMGSKLATEMT